MSDWIGELRFTGARQYVTPNTPLTGLPVTILGGGPSLSREVAAAVQCGPVIATNNAYQLLRKPGLVVALDRRWIGWHGQAVAGAGHTLASASRPGVFPDFPGRLALFRKDTDNLLPQFRDALTGANSGHAAIALAYLLGAKTIYLAGFDMGFSGGRSHWHEGHATPSSEANYINRFRPKLEDLVQQASLCGVEISAITDTAANIPLTPLDAALKELMRENCMGHTSAPTGLPG